MNYLHVHSMYSLKDSAATPEEIVKRVKELGGKNVTLTDHGTLLGYLPFLKAGKKYGINTIPGVEAYTENRHHLLLVPKNEKGFRAISYALRDANEHLEVIRKDLAFPIMTDDILKKYFTKNQNVIATSACVQGKVPSILLRNYHIKEKYEKAEEKRQEKLKKTEQLKEAYELYETLKKKENEAKERKTALKEEKKTYKKYQSATFLKKISKLEEKTKGLLVVDTVALDKFKEAKMLYENAVKATTQIEKEIKEIEVLVIQNKKEMESYKKAHDTYEKNKKANVKVELVLEDEQALYHEAKEALAFYKSIFPHFYIELSYHGLEMERIALPLLVQLAKETNTPLIAANDAHMVTNSEADIEARRLMRFNYFKKAQKVSEADKELYLKTSDEIGEMLSKVIDKDDARKAIENLEILNECKVELPKEKHYPKYIGEDDFFDILKKKKEEEKRKGTWSPEKEARLQKETKVISDMGFIDYHMIVRDMCQMIEKLGIVPKEEIPNIPSDFSKVDAWLKEKGFENIGIGLGRGRGSAVGSLACYMLGITGVDPVKYNLLFERFLNPERVTMPDIDSDVKTSLRSTIIRYLEWRYGKRAVCQIATKGTYAAKAAIQLVGRDRSDILSENMAKKEIDKFRSSYARKHTLKLSDLVSSTLAEFEAELKQGKYKEIASDKECMLLLEKAKLIEGKISNTGVHAGGVVISDNENINDYVPLAYNSEKKVWVAQCDMNQIEEIGLLKLDLLGLNTLDIISDCVHLIKKHHGVSIDLSHIPFEAEVCKQIYAKGNTNSVFQFESGGMKNTLKDFNPESFEDLILLNAAYRPGPMQYIDEMISVKRGKAIHYVIPQLGKILNVTYGKPVYQEQIMAIFQLAGFTLGESDIIRRYMSKKKEKEFATYKPKFVEGFMKKGGKREEVEGFWNELIEFAKYAFNRSHATGYTDTSYLTAWLKYHFTNEFFCSMFNNKSQDEFNPILEDLETFHVSLLPPNINESYYDFTVCEDGVRYGFGGIKNVGSANKKIIDEICKNRKDGIYRSMKDFLIRNILQVLQGEKDCRMLSDEICRILPDEICKNREEEIYHSLKAYMTQTITQGEKKYQTLPDKLMKTLIDVGCFDSFYNNRLHLKEQMKVIKDSDKENLIKLIQRLELESTDEKDMDYNLDKEMELLGVMVSENPLDGYGDDESYHCKEINNELTGKNISIFGFLQSFEKKVSKKGNQMMVGSLKGKKGTIMVFFTRDNGAFEENTFKHKVVKITGDTKEGTFFAHHISLLRKELTPNYYLPLLTKKNVLYVMRLREKTKKEVRNIPVYLNIGYRMNALGELEESLDRPIITKMMFSPLEIAVLKEKKML